MLINERIPPGTVLTVGGKEEIDGRWRKIKRTYNAVRQYRHHVMVVNGRGSISCITNAELFQNGIVTQRAEEVPPWMCAWEKDPTRKEKR